MKVDLQKEWQSLERQESMYNDYWYALNNNTEEEKEYNRLMKERLDSKRADLTKLEEDEARD
jgi:hypothetical protein